MVIFIDNKIEVNSLFMSDSGCGIQGARHAIVGRVQRHAHPHHLILYEKKIQLNFLVMKFTAQNHFN